MLIRVLARKRVRPRASIPVYCFSSTLWNAKLPIIWCANKYDIHRCSLICALRPKQRDPSTKKAAAAEATVAVAEPEPHFISLFVGWIAFFVLIAVLLLLLVESLASAEIENKNLYVCACIT